MSDLLLSRFQDLSDAARSNLTPKEAPFALSKISLETTRLETAYYRLQEELKSVNQELELAKRILTQIHEGILFISKEGLITSYNVAAEKQLQVDREEVLGKPFWNFFPDEFFGFSMRLAPCKGKLLPEVQQTEQASRNSFRAFARVLQHSETGHQGIMICLQPHDD